MSIGEIVSAIRSERLQDAMRSLLARECVVTVYARGMLRVELQGRVQLLAPWEPAALLTYKLHALFGMPAPAEPCRECPDRGFRS